MRESVPSMRYSSICNVLRQSRIWLIPTYRVYRLYDNRTYSEASIATYVGAKQYNTYRVSRRLSLVLVEQLDEIQVAETAYTTYLQTQISQ